MKIENYDFLIMGTVRFYFASFLFIFASNYSISFVILTISTFLMFVGVNYFFTAEGFTIFFYDFNDFLTVFFTLFCAFGTFLTFLIFFTFFYFLTVGTD